MLDSGTGVKSYRKRQNEVQAVQWLGSNIGQLQEFAGIMSNMDGDVATERFLPPGALDVDGERIWNSNKAHMWCEEFYEWSAVPVGWWVVKDARGLRAYNDRMFTGLYEEAANAEA